MRRVGFAVAVADAVAEVREAADHLTEARGGHGAIREVVDMLLA
jgi:3-deoxy-D-manno-octulosonate 8-phosphate phosphatase (KDO 8-P phosphatase)